MTLFATGVGVGLCFLLEPFFNQLLNTTLELGKALGSWSGIGSLLAVTAAISLLAGSIPAVTLSRVDPLQVIKGLFIKRRRSLYTPLFNTMQYAGCILLVAGSFYIYKQFRFMQDHDMGFNRKRIFAIRNILPLEQTRAFQNDLQQLPGIRQVARTCGIPIWGGSNNGYRINDQSITFSEYAADSLFFKMFQIPVEQTFAGGQAERGVIMNREAIRRVRPDSLNYSFRASGKEYWVVGITPDFHIHSLREPIRPVWIGPLDANDNPWEILVEIDSLSNPFDLARQIEACYDRYTGGEFYTSGFLEETIQRWYQAEKRTSLLIATFAALAILILLMGIFAMALYAVQQRQKEIAIRKVNGASVSEVLAIIHRQALVQVVIASVPALPLAGYLLSQWLSHFAYKTTLSPEGFIVAVASITLLSQSSILWQSWKAARMNPVESLKSE